METRGVRPAQRPRPPRRRWASAACRSPLSSPLADAMPQTTSDNKSRVRRRRYRSGPPSRTSAFRGDAGAPIQGLLPSLTGHPIPTCQAVIAIGSMTSGQRLESTVPRAKSTAAASAIATPGSLSDLAWNRFPPSSTATPEIPSKRATICTAQVVRRELARRAEPPKPAWCRRGLPLHRRSAKAATKSSVPSRR